MKIHTATFLVSLLAAAGVGSAATFVSTPFAARWTWDDRLEATVAAPDVHKVLYENDHVRLLEVTIHSGVKEPFHGHRYPSIFAYDAPQPRLANELENHEIQQIPRNLTGAGDVPFCRVLGIQGPHSAQNVDDFQMHFYRLEFKRMDGEDILRRK
jgi:hypothetical protein